MNLRIETGVCFCGAIAARLIGDPFWICYDHDDDCRRAIGAPLTVWVGYRPGQFQISRGLPKNFAKTPGVVRSFCPECGTSISYLDQGMADELYVTIGFLDNPERFRPQAHAYWSLKLPWIEFADELPRIPSYSREREPRLGKPKDRAR